MSWIRDLFGIRKDIAETKKARLETEKLEKEWEEKKSLIEKPTFDQIEKYDLKTAQIKKMIEETQVGEPIPSMREKGFKGGRIGIIIILGIFLIVIIYLLIRFVLL